MNMQLTTIGAAIAMLGIAGSAGAGDCSATKTASTCAASQGAQVIEAGNSYSSRKDIVDTAVAAGSFQTLAAALKAAYLADDLKTEGPFTVFAPTDEAFAKLPKGTVETLLRPENRDKLIAILKYHVVSGKVPASDVVDLSNAATLNGQRIDISVADGAVMVDEATVIRTDVFASNGVIHVIDQVLLPATSDIVETASSAGQFSTLTAALDAAGLVAALQGEGPFTVFAPTDAAFNKLPAGTVESLLKPENRSKLQSILKYHVVPGRVYAEQASDAQSAKTLQGQKIRFTIDGGQLMVNGADIVVTNIETSNGVIHVIDEVILPE